MSNSKKRVPNIRFKGFSAEWDVKRLGEICETFMSGSGITSRDISNEAEFPVYGGNGFRGFSDRFTHDGSYALIGRQGALCGNVYYVSGKMYISEHAIAVKGNKLMNTLWLATKLELMNLNKFSESSAQPGLAVNKLVQFSISYPSLPEQKLIGNYFQNIDNLINTNQSKLTKLKNIKKACLEKMFPKKGASVPEVRFKGFTGDWEEKRLGEICETFMSGSGITSRDISNEAEFPVYGGNGLRGFSDRFTHDGSYALIGRQGALCGNVYFVSGKMYISEHAIAVKGNKLMNTLWLATKLELMNLNKFSESSAQPGLAVNKLVQFPIPYPSLPEQQQIGNYFQNLDNLIAKQEQQLTKLKNIKKACLEKMFVNTKDAI